jgi:hypothetical protein
MAEKVLFLKLCDRQPGDNAMSDKVIISAALTGVFATRKQSPHIPYTAAEIAEEARELLQN